MLRLFHYFSCRWLSLILCVIQSITQLLLHIRYFSCCLAIHITFCHTINHLLLRIHYFSCCWLSLLLFRTINHLVVTYSLFLTHAHSQLGDWILSNEKWNKVLHGVKHQWNSVLSEAWSDTGKKFHVILGFWIPCLGFFDKTSQLWGPMFMYSMWNITRQLNIAKSRLSRLVPWETWKLEKLATRAYTFRIVLICTQ